MNVGAFSCISCSAVSCAAPAKTVAVSTSVSVSLSPASVARTPNSMPNGPATSTKGAPSRKPFQ